MISVKVVRSALCRGVEKNGGEFKFLVYSDVYEGIYIVRRGKEQLTRYAVAGLQLTDLLRTK